ncbi:hypothetical protein GCM10027429_04830 [Marivirga atlantica]|jgi:hypothetical protein|nr:hypothetical protein [Marivirga atlantica]
MKRTTKLFAIVAGVILLASACAQRTCPTYANTPVENNQEIEATV